MYWRMACLSHYTATYNSVFRINTKNGDPEAETRFSLADRTLGIEYINANSPQAKGRVERANQTLQDRPAQGDARLTQRAEASLLA